MAGREELYNRRSDPGEQHDVDASRPKEVARFRALLAATIEAARDHPYTALTGAEVELSEEVRDALRSLAYIR